MILAVMFKTTSHNCFYLESASSLLFPNPQASQVTRVHAQTSTSHPHCVQHGSTCWGRSFRERNSRGAGGGDAGIGPVVCGGDSDRELTLLTAWWTSLQCWTLLLASGHISPSPPWISTSKKLTLCQRSQLEYFLALFEPLLVFYFGCVSSG